MSRTPSHPAGTPRPAGMPRPAVTTAPAAPAATRAATGAPAAAAAAKPATGGAPQPTRRNLIIGSSAAGGLAILVALFVWKPWAPRPPRLNEDPAAVAKFAASSRLHSLPFDHQRQFMELLNEKDERLEEAYEQGALNDQEFRRALQLAWYGEHLAKMDNFYQKAPTMRAAYLDKQVDKKIRKKQKKKNDPKSDPKGALTVEEIDRDDSTEEKDIGRWPSDVRQRWAEYRAALASRKQFWKDYAKQQKATQEANKGAAPQGDAPAADVPPTGAEAKVPTGTGGQ